jgi:solute carrier family 25 carnitine/acylcarnitine transporter 20/29
MCPVSVVRTHQQNSARAGSPSLSIGAVAVSLWRHEGLGGLFRALPLEVFATGVGRGIYFWAYEELKVCFRREGSPVRASWMADWLAALGTSLVWWSCMFPFDLVKTKVQARGIGTSGLSKPQSASACAQQTLREHGVLRGLYRGFHLTLARSLVSSGTALPIYDALRPHLRSAVGA